MADLFVERDKYPVDSPERKAAARKILDLWVWVRVYESMEPASPVACSAFGRRKMVSPG
jgi:hypothetical protein